MTEEYRSVLKLDISGFKTAASEARKAVDDVKKALDSTRQTDTFTGATDSAREAASAMNEAREAMDSTRQTEPFTGVTDSAREATSAVDEVRDALDSTNQSEAFTGASAGADEAANSAREASAAFDEATQSARQTAEETESVFNGIDLLKPFRIALGFIVGFASGVREELHAIREEAAATGESAAQSAEESVARVRGGPLPALKNAVTSVFGVAKGAIGRAGSVVGNLFSGMLRGIRENLPGARQGLAGLGNDARSGAMAFMKYALGIRSVYAMVRKLKSFAGEGLRNLAQYSASTNAAISSLMSALTQLKNSLATAFAPIIEVVAPYIASFIKMIAGAFTAVSAFFAALTGKSTYTKAVAVQQDYAASLGGTASGAKDAAGATKKQADAQKELNRQLMGFDQINKLNDDSNSGSGGGSGGGGGGTGAGGGLTPAMMFTEESIPGVMSDWADMFKEAWKNADFTEIGGIIGAKLRDALDSIPWDEIKEKCNRVATSLATFLNGFVETPGLWTSIGRTIGEGLNTAFGAVNTFLETFHFESLGTGLAEGLNSIADTIDAALIGRTVANKLNAAIDTLHGLVTNLEWSKVGEKLSEGFNSMIGRIEWAKAGQTLSEGVKGAFRALSEAIQKIDWEQWGEGVRTFLVNIDWAGMAASVFEAIGSAFGGLGAFLSGLFKDALDGFYEKYIAANIKSVQEAGGNIVQGVLVGIHEALSDLAKWIYDNVFAPFIKGFKAAFSIASPAKEMIEPGRMVGEGILEGIAEPFKAIAKWVKEHILTPISEALGKTDQSVELAVKLVKDGWKTVADWVKEHLGGKVEKAIELAKEGWKSVAEWVKDKLGGTVDKAIGLTRDGWSSVASWVKDHIGGTVNKTIGLARDGWSSVGGWVKDKLGSAVSFAIKLTKGWKGSVAKALGLTNLWSRFTIKLPKVSVSWYGSPVKLPHFSLKWNAKGGILDGAQIFGMAGNTLLGGGEAGREAVLPLESNTGWMDRIADKVAARIGGGTSGGSSQPIVVKVELDGRVIAESSVREWRRQARSGRYPLSELV